MLESIINPKNNMNANAESAHYYRSVNSYLGDKIESKDGEICGIIGVTRPFGQGNTTLRQNEELGPALTLLHENYRDNIPITELAQATSCSASTLENVDFPVPPGPPTATSTGLAPAGKTALSSSATTFSGARRLPFFRVI